MRTNYHTFINPIHIKYNTTLKLNIIYQRDLKLDLNIENHIVRGVVNNTAHPWITGITWNKALDYINDILNVHQTSLEYLPSSTVKIGLPIVIIIAIGIAIAVYLFKRYNKLKFAINTFNVTYEALSKESTGIQEGKLILESN